MVQAFPRGSPTARMSQDYAAVGTWSGREYISQHKQCPHCHHISVDPFPAAVRAPVRDGPTIGAMVVSLVQLHLAPLAHACDVLHDLLGIVISEATVQGFITRSVANLEVGEEQIKHASRQAEVIHQDETGLHVAHCRQ